MKKFLVFVYSFFLLGDICAGTINLYPVKYHELETLFRNGESYLLSNKINKVSIINIDNKIVKNKSSFSISITNRTGRNIDFLFHNLQVFDQYHRPIKVLHKSELVKAARNSALWKRFASGLELVCDHINAEEARKVDYYSSVYTTSGNYIVTNGRIHDYGASRRAQDVASLKAEIRNANISEEERSRIFGYYMNYLDANTIFPNDTYTANFQIEIPNNFINSIGCLYFVFDVGGEKHTFCYQSVPPQKNPRRPFLFKNTSS